MRKYDGIIFDLDGTLCDSVPLIIEAAAHSIRSLQLGEYPVEKLRELVGPPLEHGFGEILGFTPEQSVAAIRAYREYYEPLQSGVALFPGTISFLEALREQQVPMAVASAKRQAAVSEVVAAKGLDKYLVSANGLQEQDQIQGRSSKTAVIARAIADLNAYAETQGQSGGNWVMVGDRVDDYNGALANQIAVVGVSWGAGSRAEFPQAEYVESFADLFSTLTGCDLCPSGS